MGDHTADQLPTDKYFPAAVRLWLYRIVIAAIPLLVLLGVFTGDVAGNALTIAGAVLGIGTAGVAAGNTPR